MTTYGKSRELSPRQREVVNLLVRGLSNKEIADEMGIRVQVVKNYVKAIFVKMGVESRVRLVLLYYKGPIAAYRASVREPR